MLLYTVLTVECGLRMPCVTECCHQNSRFPRYSRKTRFQTWRASGNGVLACCHLLLSPHASYKGQLSCRRPQTTHMHGPERSRMPGGVIGTVLRQRRHCRGKHTVSQAVASSDKPRIRAAVLSRSVDEHRCLKPITERAIAQATGLISGPRRRYSLSMIPEQP